VFGVFGSIEAAREAVRKLEPVAPTWARVALAEKAG
jgi:hypothetical protein